MANRIFCKVTYTFGEEPVQVRMIRFASVSYTPNPKPEIESRDLAPGFRIEKIENMLLEVNVG